MAAKVHPNSVIAVPAPAAEPAAAAPTRTDDDKQEAPPAAAAAATVLTVWRKSLLFNCDGFTVFDAKGDLAFRVDCYAQTRRRAEVILMDVAGKPLLTVRRKRHRLSLLSEHWLVYDGDYASRQAPVVSGKKRPLLSVRRHVSLRSSSHGKKALLAHVTSSSSSSDSEDAAAAAAYVVEGSYSHGRRACTVRDANGGAVVAEVRRKEGSPPSVGDDVFRLTVADPRRMAAPLAMGLVIALDEMFSSAGSVLRRTWSV